MIYRVYLFEDVQKYTPPPPLYHTGKRLLPRLKIFFSHFFLVCLYIKICK
nr:MAG TPA: hypothetical protein [Caudoviricetes sp.]